MSIYTRIGKKEAEARLNGESLSRLNRVIDYVHGHYSEDLDLHGMADIACLSPFHFHRLFNSVLAETPSQFLRRIRLERTVHKLMLEPDKPVTQIALECGFSSSQNFSRSFKAQFHFNPTSMRKNFNWHTLITTVRQVQNGKKTKEANSILFPAQFTRKRPLTIRQMLEEKPPEGIEIKKIPPCRVAYVRTYGAAYSHEAIKPAFRRVLEWAQAKGLMHDNTFLRGIAWSNSDVTPADKLIYDVCLEVPDNVKADQWVSVQTLSGGQYAVYRSLAKVRQHMDKNELTRLLHWLLLSEYRPEGPPYHNIYLNMAEENPEGLADIELCIPVAPLDE